MSLTDDELLLAWMGGSVRAGKTLVERYYAGIDRFFRCKVGDERCADLTQMTFLGAQEGLPGFRRESKFSVWLFGIARNQLLNHLRNQVRDQQRFDPDASSVAEIAPSPASVLDAEQQNRLLLAALRRLPIEVQLMLELHYWEKMPIAEIAEIVKRPINTVRTHMRRGRLKLDALMRELAESPEQLESTCSGLQGWAERIRQECGDDDE